MDSSNNAFEQKSVALGKKTEVTPEKTLRPNMIFCYGCGQQIHKAAQACPHCGAPSRTASSSLQQELYGPGKSRIVAAFLAFWLGAFGAHRFYLGNPVRAIFYILFFWTLIPTFIAMGEGVYFLCMDPQQFARKYNRRR